MKNYPETLHEWMDYWREICYRPTVKTSTYEISFYNLQILKKHLPNQRMDELEPADCQMFLNRLYENGLAKATIKKLHSLLKQALTEAVKYRLLESNPATEVIIPRAPVKKVRALTQSQQVALEIFCKEALYGDFILFLLYTGLRVGEMISLKWTDYNSADRTIFIRDSKTAAGVRELPLVEKAFEILNAQPKVDGDKYVFHNKHHKPLTYSCMKKSYENIRKQTGFADFTNHVCRHSFATRLTERGATPKSVAALLGHKKVEFALNVYTDVESQTLKKDIFLLEDTTMYQTSLDLMKANCLTLLQQLQDINGGTMPEEIARLLVAPPLTTRC